MGQKQKPKQKTAAERGGQAGCCDPVDEEKELFYLDLSQCPALIVSICVSKF